MAMMASPYKLASDSPSRQLLYELSRLGVTTQENFYARLDRDNLEREVLHKEALSLAAAEHDRVRETAVAVQQQLQLQIELERRRREEEERKKLERLRQEAVDKEIAEKKQAIAQAKIDDANARRVAEAKEAAAAAQQLRLQKEQEDAEAARKLRESQDAESKKRQVEDQAKKNAEDEAKRKAAEVGSKAKEAPIAAQRPPTAPTTLQHTTQLPSQASLDSQRLAEHQRYVEIHRKLKDLRNGMMDQAKQNKTLKDRMGDIRRSIKQSVGQLIPGKGANKIPIAKIVGGLKEAAAYTKPSIDVTTYLASPPPNAPDTNVPALLLYELNIFAKAVIAQFIDEAGVSPKTADPVGILTSHIFTLQSFKWNGTSLIDIFLAKLHVVCPVLFGIYGDETTENGRHRLGWWRGPDGGPWVSEQTHRERMTGLGAGFAAIAMRNYSKTELINPYPNYKYWQSLSYILNTPSEKITQTHFIVLKAMLEEHETRFLEIFGSGAKVVLRQALLEFPKRNPKLERSVAAMALAGLADVLKKDKKMYL